MLVENLPDRILTLDPEGTILFINHTLADLSTKEVIGTDVMSYVEEPERAAYREALDDVFSNGVSRSIELSTAGLTWWLTRLIPIKHDDVVETVLVIATDPSERKRAEEERKRFEAQVQHAQKLGSLAVLTGGIAHNFNNLLTGILGSASLASSKLPEGSPAEEQIQRILQAAEKAAALTNQMLAYAGNENFEVGFVDLNQLVGNVIPLVRTAISKNTRIRESWAANLPNIEADPVQLRQVVVALVTNASEALQDEHGEVSIRTGALKSTAHPGTRVFIEISDTGRGMDAETSKKIFDPFFTTKFTGRGLGLAAVQGIVRAHRGDIRVQSKLGRGTTVTVFLPATSPRRAVLDDDQRSSPGSTRTILVIDDEQSVREVVQAALEETGFEVLLAGSGHEALDIFVERASEIDAVLLDMSMPRMSGEQTLVKLRRMRPHVKVLLTSGHSEQEVSQTFEGETVPAFIQKPFRASELIDRLQQVVNPRL